MAAHIHRFAEEAGKPYEAIREDLRMMYDGYHFVYQTPCLYNPFSLMCALTKKNIGSYWFETGTPTILMEMLQRNHYPLPDLEEPVDTSALDSKDGNNDSIVPLLYQSGYLTILRSDEEGQMSWLTFPNEEVRDVFFRFLLPYYTSIQRTRTNAAILSFVNDVRQGNLAQFLTRLQSFFADFQYDAQTTPEAHFRNVLYILCKLVGLQVDAEYQTSDGRIDLLMRTEKYLYIIECKIDNTPRVALRQIKEKGYVLPWALDAREKILIGLNFSTKTRRPDGWIAERGDGTVIQDDIQDDTQGDTQDDTQGDTQGQNLDKWIVENIRKNSKITTAKLAELSGKSIVTIKRRTSNMPSIRYVGSGYSGHWEIIDQ